MMDNNTAYRKFLMPMLRGIFWAASLFTGIIAILLIATMLQLTLHDPITSPALSQMKDRIEKEPTNALLREEIRSLDLLARKAYFTTRWQVQFGTVLLLASLCIAIFSAKALISLSTQTKQPSVELKSAAWWREQAISRKAIVITGFMFVVIGLIAGLHTLRATGISSSLTADSTSTSKPDGTHWPSFRGAGGIGISYAKHVPTDWDGKSMQGITWKTKVPLPGNSSPVVWGKIIFITGGNKKTREVYCYNLKNGKLRWRRPVQCAPADSKVTLKVDKETGYAAPTPVCDGRRLCAIFPTGELVCYNLKGKILWQRYFKPPKNHYGHSSSLLMDGELLFVQLDQYDNGSLYALDRSNGKTVWQAKRTQLSWSSPICVHTGKRHELILTDNLDVISYDPLQGTVLWRFDCLYGEVGPSAAYAAGRVFVANESADAVGIAIESADNHDTARIIWTWDENLPSTASPVATERFVFLATAEGIISCLDAQKGTTIWEKEFETGFYASPVIAEQRVYLMDRKGTMRICAVADTYHDIGNPKLGEPSVATAALLDEFIVVRGNKHLFGIEGVNE